MERDDYLFSTYDLRKVTQNQERQMHDEIDGLPEAQLLGTNPEELARNR
jgi:hypothetical protein